MTEPGTPLEITVDNQNALEELAWAIDMSQGQFALLLAQCNYVRLRMQIAEQLQKISAVSIRVVTLPKSATTLYTSLKAELGDEKPEAVMVFGLDESENLDQLLASTNQVREEFRQTFPFPLILWINDDVLKKLLRLAPDFHSWSTATSFEVASSDLLESLRQGADELFATLLTAETNASFNRLFAQIDLAILRQQELAAALSELQERGQSLEPALQASLDFFQGVSAGTDSEALTYLQRSLEFWQQTNDDPTGGTASHSQSNGIVPASNQLRVALLLFFIGQYQYYVTEQDRARSPDWEKAQVSLQQAIEIFEHANRPDLAAKCISRLERVLERVPDWDALEAAAQKSLKLHQSYCHPSRLAQDYRYLAEVALRRQRAAEAKSLAQQALDTLAKIPEDQRWQGLHLLTLARVERQLGNQEGAIAHLKAAYDLGDQGLPRLFSEILVELRDIYLEQKHYLEAFLLKQTRLSIEQQYGIRAFVGAGRLKPKREDAEQHINQADLAESTEEIAPEIRASGRQKDLDELLQRIGDTEHRLIVVHGYSGVGKSSLVVAGLVPALRQRAIGFRNNLPVLIREYGRWMSALGQQLTRGLGESSNAAVERLGEETSWDHAALLKQLRQNEQRNLRTVLIFDQFEEFFFVYPDPVRRRQFFEFLGQCLGVLSVKVILSLREDYLHYLLECSRLSSIKTTGIDILSNNVLYGLGNFPAEDAKAIIQDLTDRAQFYLEPALVDALVDDLAGELGEVRPIELQVVGAQLQDENITTLANYQTCGETPKQELVKRYLAQSVGDCGSENQQIAELVLYLLTDEKGTRPLKTRSELERDLQALAGTLTQASPGLENALTLVLRVFVESGLVVLLPEIPTDRYQLVHDYLAAFIRQQQAPQLDRLIAELETERKQRRLREEELVKEKQAKQILEAANQEAQKTNRKAKRRLQLASGLLAFTFVAAGVASSVAVWAHRQRSQAQEITRLERAGVQAIQQFEFEQLEALVSAVQTGEDLRTLMYKRGGEDYPAASPVLALQTILSTIQEQTRLREHQGSVLSVSFSPDGKQIVTAGSDGTARLWNLDGQEVQQFQGDQGSVRSVSFSPDGKQIVTAGSDGTARLWNLDGQEVQQFQGDQGSVRSVSFSPDGKQIVTAGSDGTARLWNLDGQEVQQFQGDQGTVSSVSFSPDGKQIVTAGSDGTARLWNLDGQEVQQFQGDQGWVSSVSFSPDGKQIVTAGADGTARLWNLDGQEVQQFQGHQGSVWSVSFSPDGKQIITAGADGTARLWNLDGQEVQQFQGHQGSVWGVSFSPDGKQIVTAGSDGTARLWNLNGQEVQQFQGDQGTVSSVSFSPDGKQIVTAGDDGTARLWNLDGQEVQQFQGDQGTVSSVSFSPDGKQIVTAGEDGTARLWNLDGQEVQQFQGHQGSVWSVSFSPDGRQIVTAGADGTARLWNLDGQEVQQFQGHQGSVWSVSFSPDGKQIVTAGDDGTARLWNLDGQEVQQFQGHQGSVLSVSFSPDGKQIVTAGADGTARLWNLDGQEVQQFQGHQGSVWSVSFSPDGKQIITAGADGTARLWNLDGQEVQQFQGHQGSVWSVSFSPDGKQIITAGADGTAKLFPVLNLNQLLTRGCTYLNNFLIAYPDRLKTLTTCHDDPDRLAAAAPNLVKEAEAQARAGNVDAAIENFRTALQWNPNLDIDDPEARANQLAETQRLVGEGENLVGQGKIEEAIAAYAKAQQLDSSLEISADSWNGLCWQGGLQGHAKDVMFACEKAVALAPQDGNIIDRRGLARALTGDAKGAIEDFQVFINWTDDNEDKARRQRWVDALRAGQNPFTPQELESLRSE
jgi:WD40 repeat protein/tetratricopeptide (TPR) repeat protein